MFNRNRWKQLYWMMWYISKRWMNRRKKHLSVGKNEDKEMYLKVLNLWFVLVIRLYLWVMCSSSGLKFYEKKIIVFPQYTWAWWHSEMWDFFHKQCAGLNWNLVYNFTVTIYRSDLRFVVFIHVQKKCHLFQCEIADWEWQNCPWRLVKGTLCCWMLATIL